MTPNKWIRLFLIYISLFLFPRYLFSQEAFLSGEWENLEAKNTPIARHENGFVHVNNKFYLVGGRGLKPISIYDVKENVWSEGARPPIEIHHFQAVAHKGLIYIIGAMTGKYPYEKPLANVLVYHPKKNSWTYSVEIPKERRRGSSGVVVDNNKAYVVSGIVDGHNSNHVPWVDVFDFESKTWTELKDAPRSRDHFHAVTNDGKIYVIGGRNSSYATKQTFHLTISEVDIYDIKADSWLSLPKSYNVKKQRAGASSVFLEGHVVLIGGESISQKEAHNQVDAFNVQTKTWHKLNSLNVGRHGTQAILYKGDIYIVAGSGNRGGNPELNSLERFTTDK